jgi:hypothetical protein
MIAAQRQILRTQPRIGAAATRAPFEGIAAARRGLNASSNQTAFFDRLSGVLIVQNDPLEPAGDSPSAAPRLGESDYESPNAAAFKNGITAFVKLWHSGLVPSGIVPSAEGGVGISFLNSERQVHLEFSNDGDFSLIMFEGAGEIEVRCDVPTSDNIESAVQRARVFLNR